ncbi:MAG: hypothetical protein HY901_21660 [Deltaproteobacteria bacterium]|nr:hypothetical protein [Deltaproteobacteria bacterium]
MPDCEFTERCPFFNDRMANMPTIANFYKGKYCRGTFLDCARFQVSKAKGGVVPVDLFPNQIERAADLIKT